MVIIVTKIATKNIHFLIYLGLHHHSSVVVINLKVLLVDSCSSWVKSGNDKVQQICKEQLALPIPQSPSIKCSKMAAIPHGYSC